ncbi:fibrobacter succinogenes major paralogous domain-containing protein [Pinibacter aurantiacus]|uniref:Fibrobacter succinogenes major paralogous domain-containing protein n=1 Tax=Pinibacter aurantiacus TaxID=2851599 RepID=A0A9E2S704_9BACT|nr:fibrobacter succinogenes major paralogous domain-containing protein [Pinibacter aurantiacus]MBV4357758.1 fibrobacter succinogenes major paralogous domain-containing protein [Pinibacter aurantiacus]
MKKNFPTLLLAILLLVLGFGVQAQVMIGSAGKPKNFSVLELTSQYKSGVYGGLRLPQMTTAQRKAISDTLSANNVAANGLMVYNTDNNCVEYWNNAKWVGMCDNTFTINPDPKTPIPPIGADLPGTVGDPSCTTTGNYTFSVISGGDFATVNVTNAAAGTFTLHFAANPNASIRTAVVNVVSPCGNAAVFAYTQDGDASGCGTTTVPAIVSQNGTNICSGGAANLTLSGNPISGAFIWTLNGQQVGTGNHYTATQGGNYVVYGDKIGCSNSQSITITQSGSAAPAPVNLVVIGNNGVACGAGGTVLLTATAPAAGTVVWYHDGVKTANTGITVQAGKGVWTAVVDNGGCVSAPSNAATVTEDNSGGSIPTPTLKINGATSGFTFCQGGSAFLEVGNYDAQYTYTWYADNTQIGQGTGISYNVPSGSSVVMRVRASGNGCAKESSVNQTISTGTAAPVAPQLVGNGALCGGTSALTAQTSASSPVYAWYKDGSQIAGATTNNYTATQIGNYGVTVTSSGCTSQMSALKNVVLSDFTNLTWVQNPTPVNFGDSKVYEVSATNGPVTYNWTVSGGATITTGQGTSKVLVQFPASGASSMTVGVTGSNACGAALNNSSFSGNPVTVNSACPTPIITAPSTAQTINAIAGQQVNLSITAANTSAPVYVWKDGGGATVGSAAAINITAASGTKTYTCTVTNGCGGAGVSSVTFTVIGATDPATIPAGAGTFSGQTCFDVAKGNDGGGCGQLSARASQKTDFSLSTTQDPAAGAVAAPYTASQVYTFTTSGTVSNVRFQYVESVSGKIVQSITPVGNYSGSITSGTACKATVLYKSSLNADAANLTEAQALTVDIYAVYNNGAQDVAVKLTARIKDCACCGAYVAAGQWKTFMCYNLGATDQTQDPFNPPPAGNSGVNGDYYQWGRKNAVATATTPSGAIAGWNTTIAPNGAWTDGSKTVNDPCPAGYRVPTAAQFQGVVNASLNPRTAGGTFNNNATNFGAGVRFGQRLYLPAAGSRLYSDGSIYYRALKGFYMTSTEPNVYANTLEFMDTGAAISNSYQKTFGFSVRCVAE